MEAAEVLSTLAPDPVLGALTNALAAHPAEPAVRIRLAQALAELPDAQDVLRQLTHDENPAVAAIARHHLS